jgi:hypothetical protein
MKDIIPNPKNFNLVRPLVNLLLFENSSSPCFKDSSVKSLSKGFLKYGNRQDDAINPTETYYFVEKLVIYINQCSKDELEDLMLNVFKNEEFMQGMQLLYLIEKNTLSSNNLEENINNLNFLFIKEMNKDLTERKINKYLDIYFSLVFESIFYFQFKNTTEISQTEYEIMINYYSNLKVINV